MRWIAYLFTLPWTMTVGYGWVLLMICIGAAKAPRFDFGYGVLTAEWRQWAYKMWGYSTTLGRGIIGRPGWRDDIEGPSNQIEYHEDVHVRQVEDNMFLSCIIGAVVYVVTGNWILGLVLWWSGGLWQLPNFITAGLRFGFKNVYRDSEHERSAYAQTDLIRFLGESWEDLRERVKGSR